MFDRNESTRRTLLPTVEINTRQKSVPGGTRASLLFSAGAAVLVIVVAMITGPGSRGGTIMIPDGSVPLASAPTGSQPAYYLPGYDTVTVSADDPEADIVLPNPEGNPYHLSFEIVLKDAWETLYKSRLIEPADRIEGVTLSRGLTKGLHEAIMIIRIYEQESPDAVSKACVSFSLLAE